MIPRLMLVLSLTVLLSACGSPPQQATGDQQAAAPLMSVSPAPMASPAPAVMPSATAPTDASTTTASGVLTGTINYPVDIALPPDATLRVRLIGVPGVNEIELGRQDFASVPPTPAILALPYDPAQIDPVEFPVIYVEAVIESKGIILFEHEPFLVLTPGKPTAADISLVATTRALISGTISYPGYIALPSDATLTVWITKDSETDWLPTHQGEQIITQVQPGSTPFVVQSNIIQNSPNELYRLYAVLRGGGKVLAVTNWLKSVALNDRQATVNVQLEAPMRAGKVSGTVSYPAGTALPPDAVLTVELQDVSGADGIPPLLGQLTIAPIGPGPIPFEVEYDKLLTSNTNTYAVSAQVRTGDRLLLNNTMRYTVQLDSSATVDVVMEPSP